MRNQITLVLLLLFSTPLWAVEDISDWKIEKVEFDYYLKLISDESVAVFLETYSGDIKLLEIKELDKSHPNYLLIIYDAGGAGTYNPVQAYGAVVFNKDEKSIKGVFPWRYKAIKDESSFIQPVWEIRGGHLHIEDENLMLDERIKL